VTWSHARNAAGICTLCAGLMLGTGSAIAAAEPDSTGSTTQTEHRTNANPVRRVESLPGTQTVGRLNEVLQKTIHDVTSVFGSGRVPGQQPATGVQPARPSGSTDVKNESDPVTSSPVETTVPDNGASNPGTVISTPVDTTPPATAPVVVTVPPVVSPAAPIVPTATTIPWVIKPVISVVTSIQYIVTAAVYTVAYTVGPLASDLSSLLGAVSVTPSVNPLVGNAPVRVQAQGGPLLAPLSVPAALPGLTSPVTEGVAGVPNSSTVGVALPGSIDPAGLTQTSSLTGEVPLADTSVFPASLKRFFEHAVSAVLRSPSLSVLAALALPGFLGLLIITGAGMRFGYRQAKAALALPASRLARFAAPAPLRLVRSRATKLSRPASRFVPRELSGALDNAA
jgi:hypothetical protein